MNSILLNALVLTLVAVLVQTQQTNNDFSMGNLTETSVLLRTEHIFAYPIGNQYVTREMNYTTGSRAVVRKTEAFDLTLNGTGARVADWSISDRNSYLFFESIQGGDINFLVNVYGEIAEPNHFELGELSDLSILAHSVQLRVPAVPGQVIFATAAFEGRNISRIEGFDRNTNGTGASLLFMFGGINSDYAHVTFASSGVNQSIEFDVNFYVDYVQDLIIGLEYNSTVFLEAQIVNASSTETDIANSSVHFQLEQPRRIGMIQALSLNNQRSHINISEGGLNQHNITMIFTSQEPGSDVDYMVAVYSANMDNAHDFRLGLFQHGDSLLHTERFVAPAEIGQYVSGCVTFEADRNITMIQGFDLVPNGNGGNIAAITGGIGYRNVTVVFNSQYNQTIDFNVQIYGR